MKTIEELKAALEEAEKNYAEEKNRDWDRVWRNIPYDDLTEEQETAWNMASIRHRDKLKDLMKIVDDIKKELEELMK